MSNTTSEASLSSLIKTLQSIQIGGRKQQKIGARDLIRILQCLATLVSNGVSLSQALESIYSDRSFSKYRELLKSLSQTVRTGGSLSSGLKKYPSTFTPLVIHQVEIGEATGELAITLTRLVQQLENRSALKSFLIKKLSYPCLLIVAGIGCITFMLTNVIPTFQTMYADSGAKLPWITQFLVDLSTVCLENGTSILTVGGGLVGIIAFAMTHGSSRRVIDRYLLRLPVLGNWFSNIAVLQFTETLGNLLDSGFTLVEALPGAARTVSNRYMRERLLEVYASVRRGERFSAVIIKEQDLFPSVVRQLVAIGERTGRLNEVTRQIHSHLKGDVEKLTSALLAGIEPLLTTVLAVAIGGILLAVYLPMFDMIGSQPH